MKLTEELRSQIYAMTREELCSRWESGSIDDPFWIGESGELAERRLIALGGFLSKGDNK